MKLTFTLRGQDGKDTDLAATVDGRTTVGQLAEYLVLTDPHRPKDAPPPQSDLGTYTLALVEEDHRAVDPDTLLGESGLRSGVHLSLTRRTQGYADRAKVVATIIVVDGPDEGREYDLRPGTTIIGRGAECDLQLADASASRRHAKIVVTDIIEVTDLGSSNGIVVSDEAVDNAILRDGDTFRVGETTFKVRAGSMAAGVTRVDGGTVAFSRSPRINLIYPGREFAVPELPERGKRQPIPFAMMMMPMFMGITMFAVTRSPYSLIFVFMMPMMLLASNFESRRRVRLEYAEAMRDFREDLGFLVEDIEEELDREHDVRRAELPSVEEFLRALDRHTPLLWTRRPNEPGFMEWRLGLGTMPSRSTIALPQLGRSRAEAWLELSRSMQGLGVVADVPVPATPLQHGAVGVAGGRAEALAMARSLVIQTVVGHSPAEVMVCAFASTRTALDWDWLKWLPHTSSQHSPIEVHHTASSAPGCSSLMEQLEDRARGMSAKKADQMGGEPTILVVVENDAPIERARLVQLAETTARTRIVVLWIAPVTEQLPAACRTFMHVGPDGTARVGWVGDSVVVGQVKADLLSHQDAVRAARGLAPLVDSSAVNVDDSDIPRSVSLLTLTGPELAQSETAVIERWGENRSILTGPYAPKDPIRKKASLRAVIGQSAAGTYSVDLRTDGPHALVGGTTGAGKSELLQAWILGMAVAHSPQRITFLLVDYKGGSAFRDCVNLPHTVGMVTDLNTHLVRRALASLSAELRYREHLLARFKAKDLVELEKRGEVEAPPSLIIIVDEFAALVQEVPDFVDGVVNIAQRGRSLGIHLILATQRPAGVIKGNLRANTNLRMALRMADEDDSSDVLGTKDAAYFDPAIPGRAMAKSGPGRLVPFQTGYAGGWTSDEPPPPDLIVETLSFGASQKWELPPELIPKAKDETELGPNDIQRVVTCINAARETAQMELPRKPWLPEMEECYDLARLPTQRRDDELVFGVSDDPDEQAQPTISFRPDQEGNLAVFGASGSGKSAFLRTIALCAGFTVRGGPCQVYGLDFGNRGLAMLEDLPYVGSIIPGVDEERVKRLITMIRETIDERAVRYSKVNASTITAYRQLTGNTDEPRIFVLLDGLTAFRTAYEQSGALMKWLDKFIGLLSDGRPVGVHFILSVDTRNGLPVSMGSSVQSRLVLRMATEDDYAYLGVPRDVLTADSAPGRGLFKGREVQVAVLGGTQDASEQSRAVQAFAAAGRRSGVPQAKEIASLPEKVGLPQLPIEEGGRPVVALESESLQPWGFDPAGSFIVCGPPGSGRTTAVRSLLASLRRWKSDTSFYLVTPRRNSELLSLPYWTRTAVKDDAIKELCTELDGLVEAEHQGLVVLVLEKLDDLNAPPNQAPLSATVKRLADNDHFVIAEGDPAAFGSNIGITGPIKASRSGICLQPDGMEAMTIFKGNFPTIPKGILPEGRGVLVRRGKGALMQVAMPD